MWKSAIAALAVLWPLAVAQAQTASPPRLEVRPGIWFEVAELKRLDKNMVGLKFAIDNQSAESTTLTDLGMSDNGQRVTDLKLIDFQGGKDYWIAPAVLGLVRRTTRRGQQARHLRTRRSAHVRCRSQPLGSFCWRWWQQVRLPPRSRRRRRTCATRALPRVR